MEKPQGPKELGNNSTSWLRWAFHLSRRLVSLRPLTPKKEQLKSTSWLDGLRGFAALLVYFHHHQIWVHNYNGQSKWIENSYGFEGEYYFLAMPFVRTFFSGGHYAVSTFFVISGYVLSTKSLKLIHNKNFEELAQTLSSALFRRWIRLFLPVLVTTFLWMTSWHAFGWWCNPFDPQPTYFEEVVKWYNEVRSYMFLYKKDGFPWIYYNLHTWSIPDEFKGSILVYTVALALATCTRNARLLSTLMLTFYFMYMVDGWWMAMFLAGMLLCDLDMLAAGEALPKLITRFEPYKNIIFPGLFIVSIYFGGVPQANNSYDDLKRSPGWQYLSYLKPTAVHHPKWFFLFWAATFLVASVPRIAWLKSFFETRFCQYLGKVSFSLYLLHGPVIWTLGNAVYLSTGWGKDEPYPFPTWFNQIPISKAGPMGLEPAFWLEQIILLPVTLWVSNIATVLIDEPSVKVAAWARRKVLPAAETTTVEMDPLMKK